LISGPVVSVDLNTAPRRSLYWAVLPSFAGAAHMSMQAYMSSSAGVLCLSCEETLEGMLQIESGYKSALPTPEQELEGRMDLPKTASAVVIGGGVVGCSIAYHLARRGLADVVVVERETVGSEPRARRRVASASSFPRRPRSASRWKAIRVFERFQDEFGVDPGYKKIGYLFLLSDAKQLRGFEKRIALQRKLGADVRVITPDDARKLVPALRVDDLIAAVWGPGDGLAGPAEVTNGFARRARELGVKIVEGVRVSANRAGAGPGQWGDDLGRRDRFAPSDQRRRALRRARRAGWQGSKLPVHPRRRHIFFTEPFPAIPVPFR